MKLMFRDPRSLLIPLFIFLLSCSESYTYNESVGDFANKVWKKERSLSFKPNIQDTAVHYKVLLDFRHVYGFASPELKIRTTIIGPNGEEQQKEGSFQILEGGKKGEEPSYVGSCSGDICDRTLVLFENLAFQNEGKHEFLIEQRNREQLPNVMEVGLKLQKRVKGEDVVIQKKALDK